MATELKRILLVEDSPQDVELTLAALEEQRLANEVVVACDGEQALDYLFCRGAYRLRATGNPAIVLLDLKLPKLSGLEVLQKLKADDRLKLVPVAMLTSSREDRDLTMAYSLGVNAYVVKPVKLDEFIGAVQQLGLFWGLVNEPPPGSLRKTAGPT